MGSADLAVIDVYVTNQVACLLTDRGIQMADLRDPRSVKALGRLDYYWPRDGSVRMSVSERYAFVITGGPIIHVVDLNNPQAPVLVSTNKPFAAANYQSVFATGRHVYLGAVAGYFYACDAQDPADLRLLNRRDYGRAVQGIDVYQQKAYLAMPDYGLKIVDVSNPSAMPNSVSVPFSPSPFSVAVQGSYAFIGSFTPATGLQVVSLATSPPTVRAPRATTAEATDLHLVGQRLYVATLDQGLDVFNVANPINPVKIATSATIRGTVFLHGVDEYAYLAALTNGLVILAVDPSLPQITSVSSPPSVNEGQTAVVQVTAQGTKPLAYQWFEGAAGDKSRPINGATNTTFTTPALLDSASFWVEVRNPFGTNASSTFLIDVIHPPRLGSGPDNAISINGGPVLLLVLVSGTEPLQYQWYAGVSPDTSRPVTGATTAFCALPSVSATTSYFVRAWNDAGAFDSPPATVSLVYTPTILSVTPSTLTVTNQGSPLFLAAAQGTAPLRYQWFEGPAGNRSRPVAGATTPQLSIPVWDHSSLFWIQVCNDYGCAASSAVTFEVLKSPSLGPIRDLTVAAGQTSRIEAFAEGSSPLQFQWFGGKSPDNQPMILGATTSTLVTPPLPLGTYYYSVRVKNPYGEITSPNVTVKAINAAVLSLKPDGTGYLVLSMTAPDESRWQLEQSTDLQSWSPIEGASFVLGPDHPETLLVNPTSAFVEQSFYRLLLNPP